MKNPLHRLAWFSELSDRGATGVEYALVVNLVLVGSSASLEMMDERVEAPTPRRRKTSAAGSHTVTLHHREDGTFAESLQLVAV